MGQEKIFSKSDNSGSKKSSVIEDNFQNFLRNLVPFCKEFMVLTDIFGSSTGGGGGGEHFHINLYGKCRFSGYDFSA